MCLPCTADYSRLLSGHTLVPSSRWINDCCVILRGLMLHFCCSTNDASAVLWVSHRCEAVKLFVVIPLWWMYNQAHRFKSQMCGKTMIMYFKEISSTGKFWLMCIFPSCWISLPSVKHLILYIIINIIVRLRLKPPNYHLFWSVIIMFPPHSALWQSPMRALISLVSASGGNAATSSSSAFSQTNQLWGDKTVLVKKKLTLEDKHKYSMATRQQVTTQKYGS